MVPPDMADYVDSIQRGFADMSVHEETELWCEPGRALVAEASSILTKVELKKGDALYLNDGSYGSLFDAAHVKWPFPVKLYRGEGARRTKWEGPSSPFASTARPATRSTTCRARSGCRRTSARATTSRSACWGAYGVAMNTRFNGFGDAETVVVDDAPMASMFGLAERTIRLPREQPEEERKVVRLSRPKGRAGKSRRKR
jgi:ornithine decarboxylase